MEEEIVLNLWYVYDDSGAIFCLRVKPYVATGSDEEKLRLLRERAPHDWVVAANFEIPERFHTTFADEPDRPRLPVYWCDSLNFLGAMPLFEDAIREIENRLPTLSDLKIQQAPLVCITPLFIDDDYKIHPRVRAQQQEEKPHPNPSEYNGRWVSYTAQ